MASACHRVVFYDGMRVPKGPNGDGSWPTSAPLPTHGYFFVYLQRSQVRKLQVSASLKPLLIIVSSGSEKEKTLDKKTEDTNKTASPFNLGLTKRRNA